MVPGTGVVPGGNIDGASLVITGAGSVSSDAVAPERKAAISALPAGVPAAEACSTWTSDGHVITGGVVSTATGSSNFTRYMSLLPRLVSIPPPKFTVEEKMPVASNALEASNAQA